MFSKNNKISKRQMFRLLTYDLMGIGTLLLPAALAKATERNGMLSILTGIAAGLGYCMIIGWQGSLMEEGESYPKYLKRCFGKVLGAALLFFYVLYYLCLGGYTSYIFGHLMVTDLLKEQSFYWITAGVLFLCVYGILQGIEGRARIYEILFWFLMAPLFLMLFFAARDIELPRLFPLFTNDANEILTGSYFCFEMFSLTGVALYLVPFAKKKESIRGACVGAVLFSGAVLFALFVVLQGMFGTSSMEALEYPAVTLMSMIQIPGGFLQRQDALMVAIWFFTVFALLSSSMFYTAENLKEFSSGKKEKWWIAFAAFAFFGIAVFSYRSADFTKILNRLFLYAGTPLAVLIPLFAGVAQKLKGKGKHAALASVLLGIMLLFSGCSTMELENRIFPLAMGLDKQEDSCRISFKFQDLSKVADENAESSSKTDFYIQDKDFFTGVSKYANNTNKIMDYNHLKALVLSKEFVEDLPALKTFLEICGKEDLIARNTLIFMSENAAEILALDENLDTAVGSYLEEMMESREDYKLKTAVTLGDLYNEAANKEQLLLIPVLAKSGGLPVIRNYYAFSYGEPKGEIGVSEAVLSYLCQGSIKKLAFSLEDKTPVSINRIRTKEDFLGKEKLLYCNKIRLEAVVEQDMDTGSGGGDKIKRQLEELFLTELNESARRLLNAPKIDLTNSFYKLGMYDRGKYEMYQSDTQAFLDKLQFQFEVEVILVNERG